MVPDEATDERGRGAGRRAPEGRELLLDAAERLMSERGYAGTPVSAICQAAGVAPTSLYWHFGSKEGLLASVMERGAARWFAALPRWDETTGDAEQRLAALRSGGAAAVGANPLFLRLFYLLALEGARDEVAVELVRRVRVGAHGYFRDAIAGMLVETVEPAVAREAADELARFAVACSDGFFFASQIEGIQDLSGMYGDLMTAVAALAPSAVERARARVGETRV
jgi:AcrR family transcriptional regulator